MANRQWHHGSAPTDANQQEAQAESPVRDLRTLAMHRKKIQRQADDNHAAEPEADAPAAAGERTEIDPLEPKTLSIADIQKHEDDNGVDLGGLRLVVPKGTEGQLEKYSKVTIVDENGHKIADGVATVHAGYTEVITRATYDQIESSGAQVKFEE